MASIATLKMRSPRAAKPQREKLTPEEAHRFATEQHSKILARLGE